jgi:hypothetical protein
MLQPKELGVPQVIGSGPLYEFLHLPQPDQEQ